MGKATALWHVGLTVRNLERSLDFYHTVLGWKVVFRSELKSEHFARLTANPGAHILTAHLSDGVAVLQLIEYVASGGAALPVDHKMIGSAHLSFYVDNIELKHKELASGTQVVVTSPPITSQSRKIRSFYVKDPDGVPVEFVERLET